MDEKMKTFHHIFHACSTLILRNIYIFNISKLAAWRVVKYFRYIKM